MPPLTPHASHSATPPAVWLSMQSPGLLLCCQLKNDSKSITAGQGGQGEAGATAERQMELELELWEGGRGRIWQLEVH